MASGALLFGLTFMVSDPSTLPQKHGGQWIYGVLIGVFLVVFRYFGAFDVEIAYALLLANALAPSCDCYADRLARLFDRLKSKKTPQASNETEPADATSDEKAGAAHA